MVYVRVEVDIESLCTDIHIRITMEADMKKRTKQMKTPEEAMSKIV